VKVHGGGHNKKVPARCTLQHNQQHCTTETAYRAYSHAAEVFRDGRQGGGLWQRQGWRVGHGQAAVPEGLEGGVGLWTGWDGGGGRRGGSRGRSESGRCIVLVCMCVCVGGGGGQRDGGRS
jgi:hypothetical protein